MMMGENVKPWTHEESYRGYNIAAVIHRSRLRNIIEIFRRLDIPGKGKMADFGCSSGFILSELQQAIFTAKDWKFFGFDHSQDLLRLARNRKLPRTDFNSIDLNTVGRQWTSQFDIAMCLETLEHTGDWKNALENLYDSCCIGGTIVISVPNEKGLQGLVKFFGRKLLQRDPYGDFFAEQSQAKYVLHLFSNRRIDMFRTEGAPGWGPHLGFDWEVFRDFLRQEYVAVGRVKEKFIYRSFPYFNLFFIFEKRG